MRPACDYAVSSKGERWLSDFESVKQGLITAVRTKSDLWSQVSHTVFRNGPLTPPMWARRLVILALDSVCVWHHAKALCRTRHFSVYERWKRYNTILAPLAVDYISHDVTHMFPDCERQWVWSTSDGNPFPDLCDFQCVAGREFKQLMWYLHTTRAALAATTSLQRLRVHALFKHRKKGWSNLWAASDYQQLLCNAYTRAIRTADRDSNLGRWAHLLEFRITHLPYQKISVLWMILACSHIHQWSLATPVYGHMIYVVFHVHLFCLYIGRTKGALITPLRKH